MASLRLKKESRSRETPYVDRALYKFLVNEQPRRNLDGWPRLALSTFPDCRQLVIPPDAVLRLDYGLEQEYLEDRPFAARFVAELRDEKSGITTPVLDEEVRSDQEQLARTLRVSLADRAMATTQLCLDAQPVGDANGVSENAMVWLTPMIRRQPEIEAGVELDLTRAEKILRERQLREIGYIQ